MKPNRSKLVIPLVLIVGTIALLGVGGGLFLRSRSKISKVTLDSSPKGVTVVEAKASTFRPRRRYVGTVEPWVEAKIGPQLVSAYVDTVLVRPGAVVKRGEIIATLDCRSTSTQSKAVEMQARSVAAMQAALAKEASRVKGLLDGGYASPNEAELKEADSESKQAKLFALQAQLQGTSLQVNDCVLRAPFDGEISQRFVDPGAFVRPGEAIAAIVDRRVLRITTDVPEEDNAAVQPGTPLNVHVLATGAELTSNVTRRAPSADLSTRTIHIESDVEDAMRAIPVGTTAEIKLEVGQPMNVTEIPLIAAAVKGSKANIWVLDGDVVHEKTIKVLGELGGSLFVDLALKPGTWVVTEGRIGLAEGDHVEAKRETTSATTGDDSSPPSASVEPPQLAPAKGNHLQANGDKHHVTHEASGSKTGSVAIGE